MRIFYSFSRSAEEIVARIFRGRFSLSHKKNGAPVLIRRGESVLGQRGVPFISISHSAGLTVVAVAREKIGVDVEKIQMRKRVMRKYCPETRDALQFTRWWTEREAYGKWTEEGVLPYLREKIPRSGFSHTKVGDFDICVYCQNSGS